MSLPKDLLKAKNDLFTRLAALDDGKIEERELLKILLAKEGAISAKGLDDAMKWVDALEAKLKSLTTATTGLRAQLKKTRKEY